MSNAHSDPVLFFQGKLLFCSMKLGGSTWLILCNALWVKATCVIFQPKHLIGGMKTSSSLLFLLCPLRLYIPNYAWIFESPCGGQWPWRVTWIHSWLCVNGKHTYVVWSQWALWVSVTEKLSLFWVSVRLNEII